jgi:hypothetical protein
MMNNPQRYTATLVIGDYSDTTFLAETYAGRNVYRFGQEKCRIGDFINERIRLMQSQAVVQNVLLVIDIALDEKEHFSDSRTILLLLLNRPFLALDVLVLDAALQYDWISFSTSQGDHIDNVVIFPFGQPLCSDSANQNFVFFNPGPMPVRFGECIDCAWPLRSGAPTRKQVVSYQPPWSPQLHHRFHASVKERVHLLLLAQRDAGSLLSRLDKSTLITILCLGAGMD